MPSVGVILRINPAENEKSGWDIDEEEFTLASSDKSQFYRFNSTDSATLLPSTSTHEEVYNRAITSDVGKSLLRGNEVATLAYGFPGSGKTFSLFGTTGLSRVRPDARGIVSRVGSSVFDQIQDKSMSQHYFRVTASFYQVFPDGHAADLLDGTKRNLPLRKGPGNSFVLEGLSEATVSSSAELVHIIEKGLLIRNTTGVRRDASMGKLHPRSSAKGSLAHISHAVFTLRVEHLCKEDSETVSIGAYTAIDLAGLSVEAFHSATDGSHVPEDISALHALLGGLAGGLDTEGLNSIAEKSSLTQLLKPCLNRESYLHLLAAVTTDLDQVDRTSLTLDLTSRLQSATLSPKTDEISSNLTQVYRELKAARDALNSLREKMKTSSSDVLEVGSDGVISVNGATVSDLSSSCVDLSSRVAAAQAAILKGGRDVTTSSQPGFARPLDAMSRPHPLRPLSPARLPGLPSQIGGARPPLPLGMMSILPKPSNGPRAPFPLRLLSPGVQQPPATTRPALPAVKQGLAVGRTTAPVSDQAPGDSPHSVVVNAQQDPTSVSNSKVGSVGTSLPQNETVDSTSNAPNSTAGENTSIASVTTNPSITLKTQSNPSEDLVPSASVVTESSPLELTASQKPLDTTSKPVLSPNHGTTSLDSADMPVRGSTQAISHQADSFSGKEEHVSQPTEAPGSTGVGSDVSNQRGKMESKQHTTPAPLAVPPSTQLSTPLPDATSDYQPQGDDGDTAILSPKLSAQPMSTQSSTSVHNTPKSLPLSNSDHTNSYSQHLHHPDDEQPPLLSSPEVLPPSENVSVPVEPSYLSPVDPSTSLSARMAKIHLAHITGGGVMPNEGDISEAAEPRMQQVPQNDDASRDSVLGSANSLNRLPGPPTALPDRPGSTLPQNSVVESQTSHLDSSVPLSSGTGGYDAGQLPSSESRRTAGAVTNALESVGDALVSARTPDAELEGATLEQDAAATSLYQNAHESGDVLGQSGPSFSLQPLTPVPQPLPNPAHLARSAEHAGLAPLVSQRTISPPPLNARAPQRPLSEGDPCGGAGLRPVVAPSTSRLPPAKSRLVPLQAFPVGGGSTQRPSVPLEAYNVELSDSLSSLGTDSDDELRMSASRTLGLPQGHRMSLGRPTLPPISSESGNAYGSGVTSQRYGGVEPPRYDQIASSPSGKHYPNSSQQYSDYSVDSSPRGQFSGISNPVGQLPGSSNSGGQFSGHSHHQQQQQQYGRPVQSDSGEGSRVDSYDPTSNGDAVGEYFRDPQQFASSAEIHTAAMEGVKPSVLKKLVFQYGVEYKDPGGRSPLMYAVLGNQPKMCEVLIQMGANVDAKDSAGLTPLLWASYRARPHAMKVLLRHNADVQCSDPQGRTVYHWSMKTADTQCIKLVCKHTKNGVQNKTDSEGLSPLHWAVMCDQEAHIHIFLTSTQVDATCQDPNGRTALNYAILSFSPRSVKAILDHAEEVVNLRDGKGRTSLHYACAEGSTDCIRTLLTYKSCNLHCTDYQGTTPLHWAAAANQFEVLKLLLRRGSDRQQLDKRGMTPIGYAQQRGFEECVKVLETYGLKRLPSTTSIASQFQVPSSPPPAVDAYGQVRLHRPQTRPPSSSSQSDDRTHSSDWPLDRGMADGIDGMSRPASGMDHRPTPAAGVEGLTPGVEGLTPGVEGLAEMMMGNTGSLGSGSLPSLDHSVRSSSPAHASHMQQSVSSLVRRGWLRSLCGSTEGSVHAPRRLMCGGRSNVVAPMPRNVV